MNISKKDLVVNLFKQKFNDRWLTGKCVSQKEEFKKQLNLLLYKPNINIDRSSFEANNDYQFSLDKGSACEFKNQIGWYSFYEKLIIVCLLNSSSFLLKTIIIF